MARTIKVTIVGDPSSLQRAFRAAGAGASGFERGLGKAFAAVGKAAVAAGAAVVTGFVATLTVGFKELAAKERAMAQTEAVLKSTGRAASTSAKDIAELAGQLSRLSGIDDNAIQGMENLLLTFTGIPTAGKAGKDFFADVTETVLDMSVAMGTDLNTAAIQVGKALQDPIAGLSALRRVGVSFTEAQKEQIKTLVESGDKMGAMRIILGELTKEFGGSAKALGDTFTGRLNKVKEKFEDIAAALAEKLMPYANRFLDWIGDILDSKDVGEALGKIASGIASVGREIFATVRDAIAGVDWGGVWGTLKGFASGLFSRVRDAIAGIDWAGVWGTLKGFASGLAAAVAGVDWAGVWGDAVAVGQAIVDWVATGVRSVPWGEVADAVGTALAGALGLLEAGTEWVWDWITRGIEATNWQGIGETLGREIGQAVRGAVDLGIGSDEATGSKSGWQKFADGLKGKIRQYLGTLNEPGVWVGVVKIPDKVRDEIAKPFIELGKGVVKGFLEGIGFADFNQALGEHVSQPIIDFFSDLAGTVGGAVSSAGETIGSNFMAGMQAGWKGLKKIVGELAGFILDAIAEVVEGVGDFAGWFDWVPGIGDDLKGFAGDANDAADSLRDLADSLRDQGDAADTATGQSSALSGAVGLWSGIFGGASGATSTLTGKLGELKGAAEKVPTRISTHVETPGAAESRSRLDDVTAAAHEIPPSRRTSVTTPGAVESKSRLDDVAQAAFEIPPSRRTSITTPGAHASERAARDVAAALNSIPRSVTSVINVYHVEHGTGGHPSTPGLQHGARGFRGGLAMVGEAGPELVRLPKGSDVIPHPAARRLAAQLAKAAAPNPGMGNVFRGAASGVLAGRRFMRFPGGAGLMLGGLADLPQLGRRRPALPAGYGEPPRRGGGVIVNITVNAPVTSVDDLARTIRDRLINLSAGEPALWGARA